MHSFFARRRGFSMGADKVVTITEREPKRSTFKSMRSLIRFGRRGLRDSSGDEEQGLLDMPGPSTEPDRPISQTSVSSDEMLVDTRSPTDTPKIKKMYVYFYCEKSICNFLCWELNCIIILSPKCWWKSKP